MDYILYFCRFLYRIRWWLLLGTCIITLAVIYATKNLGRAYRVEATVYTGIISGYTIEGNSGLDWAATNNAIDNLVNIMKSENTLKHVSYRLYARNMINGNLEKDNRYLTANSFRDIYNHTKNSKDGKALLALIDKNSEERTVENMLSYEEPVWDNYIYGLFYWNHRHYSYQSLKSIKISRKGNSDLLEVSYTANDPGIAYNTIAILMEEFVNEYNAIRYGETDKVIEFFRAELDRVGHELRLAEDSLTRYNIEKRVINYYDETKEIASINATFELSEQSALMAYNGSRALLDELERQMNINIESLKTNSQFVNSLNNVSVLTSKISEIESFAGDGETEQLADYRKKLEIAKEELAQVSDRYVENQYTKEGISRTNIVEQWLEQLLVFEKAKSDLLIIQKSRQDLNDKYVFYAPVGSTIKRKERQISFTERNYLTTLESYQAALMRKKNLEMTSATLKVLNPPAFPISAEPTGRSRIVIIAFVAAFLFILGFFLLVEILDHTLRDRIRAERITGLKVLGAFPGRTKVKYKNYNSEYISIGTKFLSNIVLGFFTNKKENTPYIVNFLSTESGDGKSYLSTNLEEYWNSLGMKVRRVSWDADFDVNDPKYLLAKSIHDIYPAKEEDILIVEYPNLKEYNISGKLLDEANLNLMVARADRAWKGADKLVLEKLEQQTNTPIYFYLNKASMEATESFTGMLPPETYFRKLGYRLSQLGLTEHLDRDSVISREEHE
ncbi:hypothetical protein D0T50_07605 [Bacteroides sp. 214]|uniref:GumC family protein n=1 Tax=Bacteroides sp. 214 TaxID=2302935 RepID=UPI0013D11A7F|nr:hypothetical protein [Bacteroides sp. 214]NDW12754.1 hypothetical protein [Bacteroides sp. 214]